MSLIQTWQSQIVTYGRAFMNTVVAAWKTTPTNPLINSAKIRLSNNPTFTADPAATIAALAANECAYSGYTAGGVAITLTTGLNLNGNTQGASANTLFEATTASPFVTDVAYGYWIDDGTNVIAMEAFGGGNNAAFASPGSFLDITLFLPQQLIQTA